MGYICPVCNYPDLDQIPYDEDGYPSNEICPCCGFKFGLNDHPDKEEGIKNWRKKWAENNYKWFDDICRPFNWNPIEQLSRE